MALLNEVLRKKKSIDHETEERLAREREYRLKKAMVTSVADIYTKKACERKKITTASMEKINLAHEHETRKVTTRARKLGEQLNKLKQHNEQFQNQIIRMTSSFDSQMAS